MHIAIFYGGGATNMHRLQTDTQQLVNRPCAFQSFYQSTALSSTPQRSHVALLLCCFALCIVFSCSLSMVTVSLPIYYYNLCSFYFSWIIFVLYNVCKFGWFFVGDTKSTDVKHRAKGANKNLNWQNHRFLNDSESRHWKARVFLRMKRKHIWWA